MNPIFVRILSSLGISLIIYLGIATTLIIFGVPKAEEASGKTLVFSDLYYSYAGIPELQTYEARDGATLNYRFYASGENVDKFLVLLHGSGWHSRYFFKLASYLSEQNLAHVITPDLRGHGENPIRRGDVDYIGQYEDDIADLIQILRNDYPDKMLIVSGHSSGGGLALRFGGSKYSSRADAYLLLSPFLKYNAPTARKNAGGWATPYTGRIAGLVMLNNIGIRFFNHLDVIRFNMPEEARDGTETLAYTFRLNTAYAPQQYKRELAAIEQPLLVLVGTADEAFLPEEYEPTVMKYNPTAQVQLLPGVSHNGIVVGEEIQEALAEWLQSLD